MKTHTNEELYNLVKDRMARYEVCYQHGQDGMDTQSQDPHYLLGHRHGMERSELEQERVG